MFDLSFLTKKDIEVLNEKAELTEEQKIILEHLRKNDLSDDGIMMELRLSRNKYYKMKEKLFEKIIRTAVQS